MKKQYIQPTIEVVEIKTQASLLDGSIHTDGLGGDQLILGDPADPEEEGA